MTVKLRTGLKRLSEAGDNPSLLGSALVSIHGALEDHFRSLLSSHKSLTASQRITVADRQKTQWIQLLDLLEQHEEITASDRQTILRFNNLRQSFAHGDEFDGTAREVQEYATFVKDRIEGNVIPRVAVSQEHVGRRSIGKVLCPCGSRCRGFSRGGGPPSCYQSSSGDSMPHRFLRRELAKEKGLGGKIATSFAIGLIEAFSKLFYESNQCPVCGCEVLFAHYQTSDGANTLRVVDTSNC